MDQTRARRENGRYLPGLDGLRAIAVVAVVAYHADLPGVRGGFLGVDVFFVLSGFLITSLLLDEHARTGTIRLRGFYFRRARRLLPAVLAMMTAVAFTVAVWLPDQAAKLRSDIVASLGYVTNWWLIHQNASYFGGSERPSLLRHLWSLAVEEQFYLAWPILLVVLLAVTRGRRGPILVVVLLGIGASTALMAHLYSPWQDTSRLYYGTDTRAAPLLVGAALALCRTSRRTTGTAADAATATIRAVPSDPEAWTRRAATTLAGLVGLIGLGLLGAAFARLHDTSGFLYRGGFLAVAVAAAAAVAAVSASSRLVGFLRIPPLVWLGTRSYAIYLWHWPVFDLVRPGTDVHESALVVRSVECCVILVLADVSFRFVENPIRRGGIGKLAAHTRHGGTRRAVAGLGLVCLVGGVGATAATAAVSLNDAAHTDRPRSVAVDTAHPDVPLGLTPTSTTPNSTPTQSATAAPPTAATGATSPSGTSTQSSGQPFAVPVHVSVFGDSQGMTLVLNMPPDTGRYLKLDDQTIEGCGILLGRIASRSGEKRDLAAACSSWPQKWAAKAAAEHPQIALVMLGAWDPFDLVLPDRTLTFGSPAWDTEYLARLDQGVKILQGSGAQVAIALLPVYRPVGKPGVGAGYWPERGDDARIAHINDLLKAYVARTPPAASGRPTVFLVKPPAEFSAGNPIASNTAYRWDGVHFYKQGAQLYLKTVIPQLLAVPSR